MKIPSKAQLLGGLTKTVTVLERCAQLTSASHPLAWVSVGLSIARDVSSAASKGSARPVCLDGDGAAVHAVCEAATRAGVGRIIREAFPGHHIREHEGCMWGSTTQWHDGPWGDATVLPRVAWEALGPAIEVVPIRGSHRVQLRRDGLSGAKASAMGDKVAAEVQALRAHGEPTGVLLYGPPGTGKSVIARWVAAQLGGFSLRACLGDIATGTIAGLVQLMAPRVLVLDDIDRGETSRALDLAELVTAHQTMIVSANDVAKIDPALLRSRRIGLHYRVDAIEEAQLDELLAGLDVEPAARAELGRSTIAQTRDYAGHHRALGPARAMEILRGATEMP